MPPTQLCQFTYPSPPSLPLPSPPNPFDDWWAAQVTQHPFLAPTFDPWRATVPVLRRSLATLGVSTPPRARKPALVRAFEESSPLLVPGFEARLKACFPPLPPPSMKRSKRQCDDDGGRREDQEARLLMEERRRRLARLNRDELDDMVQLRDDLRRVERRLELCAGQFGAVRSKVLGLLGELDGGLAGVEEARAKCVELRESMTDDLRVWLAMQ